MREPIAIVGGGIAGLALGWRLRMLGIPFCIYEQAPKLLEIGAGLLLTGNATGVLEGFGVLSEALNRGHSNSEFRILNQSGRRLSTLRQPSIPHPALGILRSELQRLLATAFDEHTLKLGSTLVSLVEHEYGATLTFQDGSQVKASAVIGCDGIRSVVRRHLFHDGEPRYAGYLGWRGIAPTIPPGFNGPWLSESWGHGGRFGIAPMGGGQTYWYATINRPQTWRPAESRQTKLLSLFKDWHAPIGSLIEATPTDSILLNPILDRPFCRRWSSPRIVLIGDAAHPLTPNLGQGACLALEDAWELGTCIARSTSISTAFSSFQRRRWVRAGAITILSRALGWCVQLESPWLRLARDRLLQYTPDCVGNWSTRWIFQGGPTKNNRSAVPSC